MKEYVCPKDGTTLTQNVDSLVSLSGEQFPVVQIGNYSIPNFVSKLETLGSGANKSLETYNHELSIDIYNNFKDWLFETFGENEEQFRMHLMKKIIEGTEQRILITGCGLGDDIIPILNLTGYAAKIYATDLSATMIMHTAKKFSETQRTNKCSIQFSICDACSLPFPENFFDAVFHFGGINLFDDIQHSINEMFRVVRNKGKIGFGDESVAPWLRSMDYGKIAINNNQLWNSSPPIDLLPFEASDVKLEWILGNCFYFITCVKNINGPFMNLDVPHKGIRGGTMRSRFYGILEGVPVDIKEKVLHEAKRNNLSVHDWLKIVLNDAFQKSTL